MLVKFNINALENATISHLVPLVPRLEYSVNLLDSIVEILEKKRHDLKKLNKFFVVDFDETNMAYLKAIKLERIAAFSLEVLFQVKKRIGRISDVNSILRSFLHLSQ